MQSELNIRQMQVLKNIAEAGQIGREGFDGRTLRALEKRKLIRGAGRGGVSVKITAKGKKLAA